MQTSKRTNMQTEKCAKKDTIANASGKMYTKASIMADCAKVDTIAVCARANTMEESTTENLRRRIYKRKKVLRTIDGRRSNVSSNCSKTNF